MITNMDISILLFIQEHLRGTWDIFWIVITKLADGGWFWIALGVILCIFRKTRMIGMTLLLSLLINACITNLTLKNLIARPRPFQVCEDLVTLVPKPGSFSFPSGHTSVSFAGAFVLLRMVKKRYAVPAFLLAILIGFSRMYVGVHYPTDVIGGFCVGVVSSILACYIIQKWKWKKEGTKYE